jgi:hypothetical protein
MSAPISTAGESNSRQPPTFKEASQASMPHPASTASNSSDWVRFVATKKREGIVVIRATTRATSKSSRADTR